MGTRKKKQQKIKKRSQNQWQRRTGWLAFGQPQKCLAFCCWRQTLITYDWVTISYESQVGAYKDDIPNRTLANSASPSVMLLTPLLSVNICTYQGTRSDLWSNYNKKRIRNFPHSLRCKDYNNLVYEAKSNSTNTGASTGGADLAPPLLIISRVYRYGYFPNSASSS